MCGQHVGHAIDAPPTRPIDPAVGFRMRLKLIACRAPPRRRKAKRIAMLDKSPPPPAVNVPNDLAAFWMPFTANRAFKRAPRLLAGAKDMHYLTTDGRQI